MNVGGVGGARGFDHVDDARSAEAAQAAEAAGSEEAVLPRSGWGDKKALGRAVDRAIASTLAGASRPNHRTKWVAAKRPGATARPYGSGDLHSQALSVKLGGMRPGVSAGGKPESPVIVAKYGAPVKPGGTGETDGRPERPVIVAKYGAPVRPGTGEDRPEKPVIVAKYGAPVRPSGGGDEPDRPVIVAKYGVPTRR